MEAGEHDQKLFSIRHTQKSKQITNDDDEIINIDANDAADA